MLKETQHHIHSTEERPQATLGPTGCLSSLGLRPPCQCLQKVPPKSTPFGAAAAFFQTRGHTLTKVIEQSHQNIHPRCRHLDLGKIN